MNKFFLIPIIVSCFSVFQCKEHRNMVENLTTVSVIDSLSKKTTLPYGKKEIIDFQFPEKWMCGGGYLEKSLKESGYNDQDSAKYAQAYFEIIEFNRNLDTVRPIKSDLEILKNIPSINFENSDFYSVLRMPDISDRIHVYGIIFRNDDIFFNPCYITISNNEIIDHLTSYEKSKWAVMEHKVCYIDTNYIFHVKYFTNVDGYEVTTGEYEKYKISNEGKFVKIK